MDAFESLIAMLLHREGYWTITGFKVELTKAEKRAIGRPSAARWEVDVLAYRGSTNELLVVECKSYLDSRGVVFRNGRFEPEQRYKLFMDANLRGVVLERLRRQVIEKRLCPSGVTVGLGLACGHIASGTDRAALRAHFDTQGWRLFDDAWVRTAMTRGADSEYEDNAALVAAKILLRKRRTPSGTDEDNSADTEHL